MERLTGKAIVVAGGGFIGSELARRYAREGASVVLGDLDLDGARSVAAEIVAAGGNAIGVRLDGADEHSIAEAIALCAATYGGLDGLHANFASFVDNGDDVGVTELPLEAFDETMRVNVRGYFLCTRLAVPALIARGGGAVLFTSSAAAYRAEPTRVAYAMSKEACHALMRHVAVRYGKNGVRANCIAPGIVMQTLGPDAVTHPQMGPLQPEFLEWCFAFQQNKQRVGAPADIASVGALLMSDEGSFITGQIINVDGGGTMRP